MSINMADCICIHTIHPDLTGEFGPGSIVESITVNPGCPVHGHYPYTDPNPACPACTDDLGPCTCTTPCPSIVCTGGW